MTIVCNDIIIPLACVKCVTEQIGGKLSVEYNDGTLSVIVFNAEPEAHQSFVGLARAIAAGDSFVEWDGNVEIQEDA